MSRINILDIDARYVNITGDTMEGLLTLNAGLTLNGTFTFGADNGALYTTDGVVLNDNLPVDKGGTGLASYTIGDILYASAATTLARLADIATGNSLISGGVGVAPSWGKIGLTTHISGTLGIANGGTGATAFGASRIPFMNTGNTALTSSENLKWNDVTYSLTIGAASIGDPDGFGILTIPSTIPLDATGGIAMNMGIANTTAFYSYGSTVTGANSTVLFDIGSTWNTTGTPIGLQVNITNTASNAASLLMRLAVGGTVQFSIRRDGRITLVDAADIVVGTTTGTKIGTATNQKIGFFNAAPIIQQTTTSQTPSTFVANTSGIVDDSATWDGYTIGDIVKILRAFGLIA